MIARTPTLVGYYRLLLGVSQKQLYASGSGMGMFKSLEGGGAMSRRAAAELPAFCEAMGEALGELISGIKPSITDRDIDELPLLTLGAQFRGKNNNLIGQEAADDVFLAIREIVGPYIVHEGGREITVKNSAGREVRIRRAADPDVSIEELFDEAWRSQVAIEIKGGADLSNAHNRVGEAEKSHQKARGDGFRDYWTVLAKRGLDSKVLEAESPTTTDWFEIAEVLAREGADWLEFQRGITDRVGIPS